MREGRKKEASKVKQTNMYMYTCTWCYHGDVRRDRVVECPLFHVLGDKVALGLHHVQCQSLIWVSNIIRWQSMPTLCAQREGEGDMF